MNIKISPADTNPLAIKNKLIRYVADKALTDRNFNDFSQSPGFDVILDTLGYHTLLKKLSHSVTRKESSLFESDKRESKIIKARDLLYSVGRGENSKVSFSIKNISSGDIRMKRLSQNLTFINTANDESVRQIGTLGAYGIIPTNDINLGPNEVADVEFIIGNVYVLTINVSGAADSNIINRVDFTVPQGVISEDIDLFLLKGENIPQSNTAIDDSLLERVNITRNVIDIPSAFSGIGLTDVSGITFISLNGGLLGDPWYSFGDRFILRYVELIDRNIDADASILKVDEALSIAETPVFSRRVPPEPTDLIPINSSYNYELGKVVKSRQDWINFLTSNFPQIKHLTYYILAGEADNDSFVSFQLNDNLVLSNQDIEDFFTSVYNSTMIGAYLPLAGKRMGTGALKNKMIEDDVFQPSNSFIIPQIEIDIHLVDVVEETQRKFLTAEIINIIRQEYDKVYPFSSSSFSFNESNVEFLIEQLADVMTCSVSSKFIEFMVGDVPIIISNGMETDLLAADNNTKITADQLTAVKNLLFDEGNRLSLSNLLNRTGVGNENLYNILYDNFWDYSIKINRDLFPAPPMDGEPSVPNENIIRFFFQSRQIYSNYVAPTT